LSRGFLFDIEQYLRDLNKQPALQSISADIFFDENLWSYIKNYYKTNYKSGVTINDDEIKRQINIENLFVYMEEEIEKLCQDDKNNEVPDFDKCKVFFLKNYLLEYIYRSLSSISYYSYSKYH